MKIFNRRLSVCITTPLVIILILTAKGCNGVSDYEYNNVDLVLPQGSKNDNKVGDTRGGEAIECSLLGLGIDIERLVFRECEEATYVVGLSREEFNEETISIGIASAWSLKPYAELYMDKNPGVYIEFVCGLTKYVEDVGVGCIDVRPGTLEELRRGKGPTLMDFSFLGFRNYCITSEFLVDWGTLMYADPSFRKEEWFMNVFEALATEEGQLYTFPLSFQMWAVTANTASSGLDDPLYTKDSITIKELIGLHMDMHMGNRLYMAPFFDVSALLGLDMNGFIDFKSGWVDFNNNDFISSIYNARATIASDFSLATKQSTGIMSEYFMAEIIYGPTMLRSLLAFETPHLVGEPIPLVNEDRRLLISHAEAFALNANASPRQRALAWDFLKFIANPSAHNEGEVFWAGHSTNRNMFRVGLEDQVYELNRLGLVLVDENTAVESLTHALIPFASMPMALVSWQSIPMHITNIIRETLVEFQMGTIAGEEAARELQTNVSEVMNEMRR